MGKLIDLTGKRFGKLIVIKKNGKDKFRQNMWLCKCDCGNYVTVRAYSLKNNTRSCGCLQKELTSMSKKTHGLSKNILYSVMYSIKNRCYNKNEPSYKYYGKRGIIICNEWKNNFISFYNWAINNGYKKGLTIDRIDVNGNYEPNNCRWITIQEQQKNKRNTVYIKYNRQIHTLEEWAKITKIPQKTLHQRYYDNWGIEKMLTQQREIHRRINWN